MNKTEYGVFIWRRDGRYIRSEAVKIYKIQKAAENMADKNEDLGYVVREIYKQSK